ncbi:uncharacterized protein FSUBG_9680 [Fusarium subglutinans]|uniref:Uncharacterized protein n=1 Tax=Gibberella subglutinans TaxID=42677 RepID=A0A8H5PBR6_GIBSU|nr:uncharacterized protein FSUBG_9680 [Fusarium subglutinans]KAF5593772.1 hypothetical protein FSUBG_9680 [Fusarium subglutinans]
MEDPTSAEGESGSTKYTINDLMDVLQHPLAKFVTIRKEVNEGNAAAERQKLDRSIRSHVDPIAKDVLKVPDSSNTTIKAYENGAKAMTATLVTTSKTAERVDQSISNLNKNIGGVRIMANSMMSGILQALEEVVEEVRMINHNLEGIKDELRAKNILVSSGGFGPDGFAPRESLPKDSKVTFHLVIPAWYEIQVKVPLHFPDELQPLRIVGPKHGGKELVSFNLPAATADLLDGIATVLDPEGYNGKATVAAVATWGVLGCGGALGDCFAACIGLGIVTGLGPIAVIPAGFGLFPTVGAPVAFRGVDAVAEMLREEPTRILGSDRRLHREYGIDGL